MSPKPKTHPDGHRPAWRQQHLPYPVAADATVADERSDLSPDGDRSGEDDDDNRPSEAPDRSQDMT